MQKIFYILFIFSSFSLFSQINRGGGTRQNQQNVFINDSTNTKSSSGKIVDDSTKMVYGPHTSVYTTIREVEKNLFRWNRTDTTLRLDHRYNFIQQSAYQVQDLGNLGSASKSIFYQLPQQIGTRLGNESFDRYGINDDSVKYFNTKSHYTDWYYVQGGSGRTILNVTMARNIKPNLNIGFVYRKMNADLLNGTSTLSRSTRQAKHSTILLQTNYWSKNKKYRLLAHLNSFRHNVVETGGLSLEDIDNELNALYDLDNNLLKNQLLDVRGGQQRMKVRVYQHYSIADSASLQVFHRFEYSKQTNSFSDKNALSQFRYYPQYFDSAFSASNEYSLQTIDNRFGVKGRLGQRIGYIAYLRLKNYQYKNNLLTTNIPTFKAQQFVGGELDYVSKNQKTVLRFNLETIPGSDYMFGGEVETKFLRANYRSVLSQATVEQQFFNSNFSRWDNNFRQVFSNQWMAELKLDFFKQSFRPYLSFTTIDNFIYNNFTSFPTQVKDVMGYAQVGAKWHFNWKSIHLQGDALYSKRSSEANWIRFPSYIVNSALYFENSLFKNAITVQTGFDFHYQSGYYADNYMPASQQFYLQNDYMLPEWKMLEVFVNFRIYRTKFFAKMTQLTQGIWGKGYFSSPAYMGQPRQFEFGVDWQLFD